MEVGCSSTFLTHGCQNFTNRSLHQAYLRNVVTILTVTLTTLLLIFWQVALTFINTIKCMNLYRSVIVDDSLYHSYVGHVHHWGILYIYMYVILKVVCSCFFVWLVTIMLLDIFIIFISVSIMRIEPIPETLRVWNIPQAVQYPTKSQCMYLICLNVRLFF
jgi:hypothetical protein